MRRLTAERGELVSIHASAREATPALYWDRLGSCFNPRLRAGGDGDRRRSPADQSGFNPRLRAGGDRAARHTSPASTCFNPRLRAGGDLRSPARQVAWLPVSIHASAREATGASGRLGVEVMFQSTPPRGRRRSSHAHSAGGTSFQSTPPRGRRPGACRLSGREPGFNPRLRAGGDGTTHCPGCKRDPVSIHASAREATIRAARMSEEAIHCFNPRLRAGGDRGNAHPAGRRRVSIHASAREATVDRCQRPRLGHVSIHASAREAT